MVGIVLISHSQKAAEGAAELALMMAPDAPVKAAGGLEDGSLGTSFEKIAAAVEAADQGDGVACIMDMGSAVMTAEMVAESLDDKNIKLLDCPFVEGAVIAAIEAAGGTKLDAMQEKVEAGRDRKL
ncbi:dihydroxyacetone kinase phosphoryl donor subunit DhaM [Megasphaera sp.]|uniref:dihydroxyacetone kinase phosphoryl donor subunit DhaM n=1 Tax=Megasphaera sp. TaxID=2023260 RepID=UPI00286879F1|nr:dihydroxyacetone kinase phosphoryl donor subunit DhaM [uncultured Megasphaera sp.]